MNIDLVIFARQAGRSGLARALRVRAELSQSEIAREIGVSAGVISLWENGKRRPRGQGAERYGAFLKRLT